MIVVKQPVRRALAVGVLLAAGVGPLVYLIARAVYIHSPAFVRWHAEALTVWLGAEATIGTIRHEAGTARPYVFEEVHLRPPGAAGRWSAQAVRADTLTGMPRLEVSGLELRAADWPAARRAIVDLARLRWGGRSRTLVLTGDGTLQLGQERFHAGSFRAEVTCTEAAATKIDLNAHWADVDLRRLAAGLFGLPAEAANGRAEVILSKLTVGPVGLEQLAARVRAGTGSVGAAVLTRLAREHGFLLTQALPTEGIVPFDQLGLEIAWSPGRLTIRGDCPDAPGGAVVLLQRQGAVLAPLLKAPLAPGPWPSPGMGPSVLDGDWLPGALAGLMSLPDLTPLGEVLFLQGADQALGLELLTDLALWAELRRQASPESPRQAPPGAPASAPATSPPRPLAPASAPTTRPAR